MRATHLLLLFCLCEPSGATSCFKEVLATHPQDILDDKEYKGTAKDCEASCVAKTECLAYTAKLTDKGVHCVLLGKELYNVCAKKEPVMSKVPCVMDTEPKTTSPTSTMPIESTTSAKMVGSITIRDPPTTLPPIYLYKGSSSISQWSPEWSGVKEIGIWTLLGCEVRVKQVGGVEIEGGLKGGTIIKSVNGIIDIFTYC